MILNMNFNKLYGIVVHNYVIMIYIIGINPDYLILTKCHTIDSTHNTFLFLQKHLTSGTELIFIGSKIVPNESL